MSTSRFIYSFEYNQIDLQQKIVESDQENKKNTRWQILHTMEEAKTALKILFKQTAEDRRQQCVKEFDYNDLMDKYEVLQAQMEEYKTTEKERRVSRHLTQINKTTNQIAEVDEDKNTKLKQELEHYKEKCQCLEQTALMELKDKNEISKSKKKREMRILKIIDENTFPELDDSYVVDVDDVARDPDWTQSPDWNTTKTNPSERTTLKRSSDGEVKYGCKTKCATRICLCRKNNVACNNCGCNPTICQNRNLTIVCQTFGCAETQNEVEPIKKLRLMEQEQG